MSDRFDVIVVGLGAVGSAALYQLAKRGLKVLGFDRFQPPHDRGSSHGETRITRLALGEGDEYVQFAKRSHEIWKEVESATGQLLLHEVGGLVFGSATGRTSAHGAEDFLQTTIDVAQHHGIRHELLDAPQLESRFPQFRFSETALGYYEPSAGYLLPEACVMAQLNLAAQSGAVIQTGSQVRDWEQQGSGFRVRSGHGRYESQFLVVCGGPWIPELIPGMGSALMRYRQVQFWFEPEDDPLVFQPDQMPVFVRLPDSNTAMHYGFPIVGESGGVKVAGEQFERECDPDQLVRAVEPGEIQAMHELASRSLRIGGRCLKAVACQYTVTPDFGFVIDRVPKTENAWFASACSGHGFKHSAAVGEGLAQWIVDGESQFDLTKFRFNRLAR